MLVTIIELSHNGDKQIYQGLASLAEINDIRKKLLHIDNEHPYISFVINNNFFTINMHKVKGLHINVSD